MLMSSLHILMHLEVNRTLHMDNNLVLFNQQSRNIEDATEKILVMLELQIPMTHIYRLMILFVLISKE